MTSGSKKKAMAALTGQKFVPGENDDGVVGQEGEDVYSMDFSAEHIAKSKVTISGSTQLQTSSDLNKFPPITSVNTNEFVCDSKIAFERVWVETQEKIDVEMATFTAEEGDGRLEAQSLRAASVKSVPGIAEAVQTVKYEEKVQMEELGGPAQGRLESSETEEQAEFTKGKDQQQQKLQNETKRSLELPMRESKKMHTAEEKTKLDEADSVCFICFDGGDLVLCDCESCPKACHLSCIGRRDADFFNKKMAWLCGWHFCSVCTKPGGDKNFQCYTCPTAYCGTCIAQGEFLTIRERNGLCADCLPIVTLIERSETINADRVEVNFDDHETYECLFKAYWEDLKCKMLLVMPELDKDGKPIMGKDTVVDLNHTPNHDTDETDYDYSDSLSAACKKRKSSAEQMDDPEGGREVREAEEKSMDDEHAGKLGTSERVGGGRSNRTKFAAITPKNIDLIYLRRALLRELLDDPEFHNKVVGTFVRIRVPVTYRLVLVTGTRIGEVSYKAGTQTTKIMLEILNLQKQEVVTVNGVSDLDFTEEECQRLRLSIKVGFIKGLTVAQVEHKAIALREDKLNYWFKSEKERLINLKDRASEKGRKRELRECMEKLQELSNPAFRAIKFEAMPDVTSDPHMDPRYESDSDELQIGTWKLSPKATRSGFNTSNTSSFHVRDDFAHYKSKNSWEDCGRRGYHDRGHISSEKLGASRDSALGMEGKYQSRDQDRFHGIDSNWGGNDGQIEVDPWVDDSNSGHGEAKAGYEETRPECGKEVVSFKATLSVRAPIVVLLETDKMWHYEDPTGKVHGPFAMGQLRRWNKTGLFPMNLTIWKTDNNKENSKVVLIDALAGRFNKPLVKVDALAGRFKEPLVKVKADDGESGKSMYGSRSSGGEYNGPAVSQDGSRSARGRLRLERKGVPCRYYARGYCRRGEACEFWHG